ncbi:MAG TPA: MFS transporter [Casimicrobiaceae bacterium]
MANAAARPAWRSIPAGVWTLGVVSLLMDTSSELIHSLLPLFLVTTLGASTLAVGVIEGIAEAAALITKVFSGYLSDYFRDRKALTVLGYGLAAATKPIFALASSVGWVVGARFVDRVSKGIRGAPRDALIADITPGHARGIAYGLRQALDAVGAVAGPALAIVAMLWFADNFRTVFWLAVVPAVAAVALLVFGVREPGHPEPAAKSGPPVTFADVGRLSARYWWVVGIAALMTLARFSEAFLVLRAQSIGMPLAWVPLVMVVMSVVYAVVSYPAGALVDRGRYRAALGAGLLALILADLILSRVGSMGEVLGGAAVWGVHMGLTQGVLAALVAASAPADLRGTAFGLFNLVSGVALLAASVLAGWLWEAYGPAWTFGVGALFTVLAWLALLMQGRLDRRQA